jgi:AcrR family transcriptional regulator
MLTGKRPAAIREARPGVRLPIKRRRVGKQSAQRQAAASLSVEDYLSGKPEIRREIIDAAAELFRRDGYASVSMQDIGRAVGLSKAGLYHHCPSKELLLADIVRLGGALLLRQLRAVQSSMQSPIERLRSFVVTRMEVIARHQAFFTVVWQERPVINRRDFADIANKAEAYRAGVRQLIAEAIAAQEIRTSVDPHLLMLAIDGMTGWAYLWYRSKGRKRPREIGEQFWQYFAEGVLTEQARPATASRTTKSHQAP